MGCSSGACGVPQRLSQATARREGACCNECAEDEAEAYRASFLALSPWGARHAGKVLSDEGTLVTGAGNTDTRGGMGDASISSSDASAKSGASDAGWRTAAELGTAGINAVRDITQTAITERERTTRAQGGQGGYGTDGVMPPERTTTNADTSDTSGSSDNAGLALLAVAAIAAGAMSGAFKGMR